MIGVCAKDLICSQAKYHASCLCVLSIFIVLVTLDKFNFLGVMVMNCSQHMMQSIVLRRVDPKFTSYRCSSLPTGNLFDRLKKMKLKSFKDLKTITKMRTKDLVLPLQMDREFCLPQWFCLGSFRNRNENLLPAGPLPIPLVYLG